MVDNFTYKSKHKKHPDIERRRTVDRTHANAATSPSISNRTVCFSFAAYSCTVISHLSKCNVPITKGLSEEEFQQIQARFGFDFPPDLRSILQEGLPVGAGFPNWRSSPPKELLNMLNLPAKGLCNEVSRGTFWCGHWGERPDSSEDAVRIARRAFRTAPVLVPIYSHCYIPCFPNLSGNPIFFIFQKDVFYCGYDLADFFGREVFMPLGSSLGTSERPGYWPEIAFGSMQSRSSGREKRKNMSAIKEDLVMESKLKAAAYTRNEGLLYHPNSHDGHHHSHNSHDEHHYSDFRHAHRHKLGNTLDHWYRYQHSQPPSKKEAKWDALNKRLLAELQNAEAKDEILSRKSLCEEPVHYSDRPPENLVRSAGNSPRMGQGVMSRYAYFYEKPLPAKLLAQFTIAAPPWAAKGARHIPVWSDLVENKDGASVACAQDAEDVWSKKNIMKQSNGDKSQENQFDLNHVIQSKSSSVVQSKESQHDLNVAAQSKGRSCGGLGVVQSKGCHYALHDVPMQQEFEFGGRYPDLCISNAEKQASCKSNKRWLVPYLQDMEKTLRRGGWKQGEIEEMIAALPPDDKCFSLVETRGEIEDVLKSSANAMSTSLQEAGWSVPDVVDIFQQYHACEQFG